MALVHAELRSADTDQESDPFLARLADPQFAAAARAFDLEMRAARALTPRRELCQQCATDDDPWSDPDELAVLRDVVDVDLLAPPREPYGPSSSYRVARLLSCGHMAEQA